MLADRLAAYTRSLGYDDLPAEVVHEVKRRVLDSLGCALGAWNSKPCRIARELAQSIRLSTGATIWGTGHKTLPDLAMFANGSFVRYLDFNDTYLVKRTSASLGQYSGGSGRRRDRAGFRQAGHPSHRPGL